MRNPLIEFFKGFRREVTRTYEIPPDQYLRIPMTLPQIDNTILTIEDADYFKQTVEMLCDQVEDVQKELDLIDRHMNSLQSNAETFGQTSDITEVKKAVERIREFYGRVDTDDE